jgi:hypothetical protein
VSFFFIWPFQGFLEKQLGLVLRKIHLSHHSRSGTDQNLDALLFLTTDRQGELN